MERSGGETVIAEETMKIKMKVIRKPKKGSRAILQLQDPTNPFPFFYGEGDTDYVCGNCGFTFCKNVEYGKITNIVFRCPKCNKYNEIV